MSETEEEFVARAIWLSASGATWEEAGSDGQERMRDEARAAIAAVREWDTRHIMREVYGEATFDETIAKMRRIVAEENEAADRVPLSPGARRLHRRVLDDGQIVTILADGTKSVTESTVSGDPIVAGIVKKLYGD